MIESNHFCFRGFLSAQDTAWMIRSWSLVNSNPLQVLEERENIYCLLSQTTDDSLKTNFAKFTIDPKTRYKTIPACIKDEKIISLYDTDNKEEMRYLEEKFKNKSYFDSLAYQNIIDRYKALTAPIRRQVNFSGAAKLFRVLGKKSTRAKQNVLQRLGKMQNPFSRQNSVVPNMYQRQFTVHNPNGMFDDFQEVTEEEDEIVTTNKYKTQQSCAF